MVSCCVAQRTKQIQAEGSNVGLCFFFLPAVEMRGGGSKSRIELPELRGRERR